MSIAEERGHSIAFLDVNLYKLALDVVRVELQRDEWDVVCCGGLITTYKYVKQILPIVRDCQPDALIVLGGGILTSIPEDMMRFLPMVDVGVIGEGENTFHELLDVVFSRRFNHVRGLIYRDEKGELKRTEPRPLIGMPDSGYYGSLDDVPYPAYHLLDMEGYFKNSSLPLSQESMFCQRRVDIVSERGCVHRCSFCMHMGLSALDLSRIYGCEIKGPQVRYQSAEYVIEQIKHLRMRYAIDFVSILDENFLSNKGRVLKFCDLLEKEGLVDIVKWGCLGSVDKVDEQYLQRLREAGCTYISYGAESASQRILDSIGKRQTPSQIQRALDMTVKAGIQPIMTFMEGYENEKVEDMLKTVRFWKRNNIRVKPFWITPYPATAMFEENRDKILKQYGGDLEAFVSALDDATEWTVNLTDFDTPTVIGLRELMSMHRDDLIEKWARERGLLDEGKG